MKRIFSAIFFGLLNLVVSGAGAGAILMMFGAWWADNWSHSILYAHAVWFYAVLAVLVLGNVVLPIHRRLKSRRMSLLDFPSLFLALLAGILYLCFQDFLGDTITKYF